MNIFFITFYKTKDIILPLSCIMSFSIVNIKLWPIKNRNTQPSSSKIQISANIWFSNRICFIEFSSFCFLPFNSKKKNNFIFKLLLNFNFAPRLDGWTRALYEKICKTQIFADLSKNSFLIGFLKSIPINFSGEQIVESSFFFSSHQSVGIVVDPVQRTFYKCNLQRIKLSKQPQIIMIKLLIFE